jgi:uncharacterized membrane protein
MVQRVFGMVSMKLFKLLEVSIIFFAFTLKIKLFLVIVNCTVYAADILSSIEQNYE